MTTKTFTNRYPGNCFNCGTHVAAGRGVYHYGDTYCTEAHMEQTIAENDARIDRQQTELDERRRTIFIPGFIAELNLSNDKVADLCVKVSGKTTIADMTTHELAALLDEFNKIKNRRDRAAEIRDLKRDGKCVRCGGAGRSSRWALTGFVCYDCNGSGINQQEK